MRPLLAALLLASSAVLAGCATDGSGSGRGSGEGSGRGGSGEGLAEPVTVYEATLDFSEDPSGAARTQPLGFPAGARHFVFEGTWRGKTPVMTTRDVVLELRDSSGGTVAGCSMGTNGVTTGTRDCGPVTNNVRAGESYALYWSGHGTVEIDLRISAR